MASVRARITSVQSAFLSYLDSLDPASEDRALSDLGEFSLWAYADDAPACECEPESEAVSAEDRRWWAEQSDEYEAWLDDCYAARTGLDDFDMCPGGIG